MTLTNIWMKPSNITNPNNSAEEAEDLSAYFDMGVSVTNVLYGFEDDQLKVFIQKISRYPYEGASKQVPYLPDESSATLPDGSGGC